MKKSVKENKNNSLAWMNLVYCYEKGIGTKIDENKEKKCYDMGKKIDNIIFSYNEFNYLT